MFPKLYVLILAGGSGERFWPLSRKAKPKQLLSLFSDGTLLENTLRRLEGLVALQNILILTNHEQEAAVRALVPQLPADNIIAEPAKRDTAAAIALGVGWVSLQDPSATMVVLPADHLIKNTVGFQTTLKAAAEAAQQTGLLVTIGIKPDWGCPGFGYIEQGNKVVLKGLLESARINEVACFREKPNAELAEEFVRQGNFRWNSGMFIWTIPSIRSAFDQHTPELAKFILELQKSKNLHSVLDKQFSQLPKTSIDYAIMEKADRVLVVEAGFDWDDVGSWTAVAKYLKKDGNENIANCKFTTLDATNNIIFSNQKTFIALMGVKDLIVVQTGDALLICNRSEAEKIKNLTAQIPKELQ